MVEKDAAQAGHPAGPVPADRGEVAELVRMLVRTVLPVGVVLGLALAVYGGTGHDLTIVLQDRFPEDSEFSGLFTILFSSALMVCAGIALGALVVARAWFRSGAGGEAVAPSAITAGLALAVFQIFIGFDDVMMVHDAVLPGAGIPEDVGLAGWALVGAGLVLWAFRPLRREGLALPFLGALALLGGSLGGDVLESFFEESDPAVAAAIGHAEDVVKFLAYAALCHLSVLLARRIFSRVLQAATERAAREAAERAGVAGRVPMRVVPPRSQASHPVPQPTAGSPADEALTMPVPAAGGRDGQGRHGR